MQTPNTLSYHRHWRLADFTGKYRSAKINNTFDVLPGTQIAHEKRNTNARQREIEQFEKNIQDKKAKFDERFKFFEEVGEISTKSYFDAVVGMPMRKAEDKLKVREDIMNTDIIQNEVKAIEEFISRVQKNQYEYVQYAVKRGYKSLDAPVAALKGNTALHIAVLNGHIETVEQLCKFKASTEARNDIGSCPIHYVFSFWKDPKTLKKEERPVQEDLTFRILHVLLSYGAYVDIQDQDQSTILHTASMRGSVRIVKMLLGFRANHQLKTIQGFLPADLAHKCGHEECYKLLRNWNVVAPMMKVI
jgi:hypothetical protein